MTHTRIPTIQGHWGTPTLSGLRLGLAFSGVEAESGQDLDVKFYSEQETLLLYHFQDFQNFGPFICPNETQAL